MTVARLLAFLLLLVPLADQAKVLSPEEAKEPLAMVNGLRREEAKTRNISNMHELSWDDKLAARLAPIACGVDTKTLAGQGSMVVELNAAELLVQEQNATGTDAPVNNGKFVLLYPPQTKIACVMMQCEEASPKPSGSSIYCLIGPHEKFDERDYKMGSPGSACGSLKVNDGLCVANDKKEEMTEKKDHKKTNPVENVGPFEEDQWETTAQSKEAAGLQTALIFILVLSFKLVFQ